VSKKLHILFLASWYPSEVLPTNGDFIKRHAVAVSLLHNVTVVHVITDPKATQKIRITATKTNTVNTLIAYVKPSKYKLFVFLSAYIKVLKMVGDIDIIHVNKLFSSGIVAVFLKVFKKKKYIITEHHSIYQKAYRNKIGWVEKQISKYIAKKATYICPVSADLGKAMQDFGLKGHYHPIPNVVFTSIFTPKLKKKQAVFTLTHVSNMVPLKNVEGILRVIKVLEKHIKHFKFNLIGGHTDTYTEFITKNNINPQNINRVAAVSQKVLSQYYSDSDVFILFSDTENQPCVILESFSSGTPVIATNVGGINEYFPDNYGLLIDKGNEQQLLAAILKIYCNFNEETPEKMHQYAIDNFSPMSIAEQFSKLYKTM